MKAYPPDWQQRRARILARAQNRCEKCRVPNHAVGYRDQDGRFIPNCGNGICDASGRGLNWPAYNPLTYREAKEFADQYNDHGSGKRQTDGEGNHWIVIVLTVAHLDEGDLDVPDDRLMALCQRCHLLHDKDLHTRNRSQSVAAKKALLQPVLEGF